MAAEITYCPNCGREQPADTADGPCPRCVALAVFPPDSGELDATMAQAVTDSDPAPANTQAALEPVADDHGEGLESVGERSRDPDLKTEGVQIDQFVDAVDELGLMSRAELAAFLTKLNEARMPCNSEQLGRELAAAGRLTRYQAGAICQGKAKGLLIGRYTVLDKLGAGGMGMVFKAQHRRLKQIIALKILPPSLTRNPELVQRFHREAEMVAKLSHPNIVRAIDADDAGGTHFLVMEFVDGTNFSKLVKTRGALTPAKALDATIQAARGLAVAHAGGIVHRDIKPSNLMIDAAGIVKILDLGLARLTDAQSNEGDDLTLSGSLMGTVDYMSPEQAFDPRSADARSDIYSLGCTLHFLLTTMEPYRRASLMQRLLAHREAPVPSLRDRRPDVPGSLDLLFRKMVAKDPVDRPGSMSELIGLLEACRADVGSDKGRPGRPLLVFDESVRTEPPATIAESPGSHIDPTPLPRIVAADLDTPRSGSGIRLEDNKRSTFIVYGTDSLGLHAWVEFVRAHDAIPAGISVYDGGDRPAFAAIALPNRRRLPWELATHAETYQFNIHSSTLERRGFKLALYAPYRVAARSGIVGHFRKTDDPIDHELGVELTDLPDALDKIEKSAHRLTSLASHLTPQGRRFAVFSSSPLLYPQRYAYELTLDALRTFSSRARAEGFVPISLTASPVGETSCFSIVLERAPARVCDMSFGLTEDSLANEFERRVKRAFSPIVFCGFTHANFVYYNVGWIQGSLPKGL
jgi:serine/threonine protein kinase